MSLILKYDLGNPHRLPVGYTPLAYIESSGTQWIDTGWLPTGNTQEVNIHFIPTASLSSKSICGGQPASSAPRNFILHNGSYFYTADNYISCTAYNTINLKYHVRMTNNVNSKLATVTVNGITTNYAYNTATLTTTYTYHLFTNNNGGNKTSQASSCKIYYCNIINNGSMFGEYIPVKRNSDGVIGMFDIVSQTFKTNAGTGAFIAGPEVVVLPYEYQQVEYLHSDGNQYINTGYIPGNNNLVIDMIGTTDTNTPGTNRSFYGGASSGVWNPLFNVCNGHWEVGFGGYWAVGTIPSTGGYYVTKLIASNGTNQTFVVNGETLVNNASRSYTATNGPAWYLFKINNSFPMIGAIHYMKITENGTVVREYIPCYRRADMKPGMYDTVNNVFYTNSGSGEFILGPVVEESSRQLEYNNIQTQNFTPYSNYASYWTSDGATKTDGGSYVEITFSGSGSNRVYYSTSNLWTTIGKYVVNGWIRTTSGTSTVRFSRSIADYGTNVNATITWTRFSTIITTSATSDAGTLSVQGTANTTIQLRNCKVGPADVDTDNIIGLPTNVHHSTSNPSSTQINQGSGDFSGGSKLQATIPALGNNFSISWWANGTYGGTMMWGIYPFNPLYNLCLNVGDGNENPWYRPGTTTQITAPSNNVWHHFVVTGDGSSNKLYIDGVHYGTSKTYRGCSGTSLILNGWSMASSYNWNGKMCDFRIYNNVLTADEVLQIYKRGL